VSHDEDSTTETHPATSPFPGIRPEVAQTLIGLDVDFGAIVTRGNLQSGIAYTLGQTGEARRLEVGDGRRWEDALQPLRPDEPRGP
jgi:hypothetical protein